LDARVAVSAEEFDKWMSHKETIYGVKNYTPTGSTEHLLDGTYYLTKVDDKFRRTY